MNSDRTDLSAEKPAFEPSSIVEYGDAAELTRLQVSNQGNFDGPYTS